MAPSIKSCAFVANDKQARSMANRSARFIMVEQGWSSISITMRKCIVATDGGMSTTAGMEQNGRFVPLYYFEYSEGRGDANAS